MLDRILTPVLGPVLLLQGRRTRRVVERLPEAPGERVGGRDGGGGLRLLVTGDSSAAGVGAVHQDQALLGRLLAALGDRVGSWRLHAKSGSTTPRTRASLEKLDAGPFDAAVLALGVNDVTSRIPLARWLDEQARLRDLLRTRFGVRRIVVSGFPPVARFPGLPQPLRWWLGSRARRYDAALHRDLERDPTTRRVSLEFDDLDESAMADDGFHPGPRVYAEWGARAAEAVVAP